MSRALFILNSQATKMQAHKLIENAPYGTRVEFKKQKRTLPQNDHFHAILTEIASQLIWHGQKWSMEDWKKNLTACFKKDVRIMPSADGMGVQIVGGTSDFTKEEGGEFIEFLYAFGAQHGVKFNHDK